MDNAVVIPMIFTFFAVPRRYQHRVLCWGILGVIVLRGSRIELGATIFSQFFRVLHIFVAFLIRTVVQLLFFTKINLDIVNNPLYRTTT